MKEISAAIVALQADLKPVGKNATNPFFKSKYADLPSVMNMIQPLLAAHKLAVVQFITNIDGQSALKTILLHESGEAMETDPMPLILPKNDPQAQGSAITYARRYSIQALLGIVADRDDDGQTATESVNTTSAVLGANKAKLYAEFGKAGVKDFNEQKKFVADVLGKETVESVPEAELVLNALAERS